MSSLCVKSINSACYRLKRECSVQEIACSVVSYGGDLARGEAGQVIWLLSSVIGWNLEALKVSPLLGNSN